MTEAGSEKHKKLLGIQNKITKDTLIPKELADALIKEVQALLKKGFKLEHAVRIGTTLTVKRWEKKNADKSGG